MKPTDGEGMEFCWKLNYIQMNDIFSEVHQTALPSPLEQDSEKV